MRFLPKSRRSWAATIVVAVLASFAVWYAAAYPRGMLMARIDHARGHYEVKAYGMPSRSAEGYYGLLWNRYGVETNSVAGCVVSWELVQYADGYNSVSRRRLIALHGKDIFAECDALAQAEGDAAGGPR